MAAGKSLRSGEKDGEGQPGLTLDAIESMLHYLQTQNTEMIAWAIK